MDFDLASMIERLRTVGADVTAIEAKSAAGGLPQSVIPTMCAFANLPGGGLIILGLDESNRFSTVTLSAAATLAAGLASMARSAFEPPLQISVDVETFEKKELVVARVHELPLAAKPCVVKRTGHAYLRFFDGDYTLSRLEMDGFIANRTRPRFDEAEVPGARYADLDPDRVDDFLATARANEPKEINVAQH